jgi:hypothetical protein
MLTSQRLSRNAYTMMQLKLPKKKENFPADTTMRQRDAMTGGHLAVEGQGHVRGTMESTIPITGRNPTLGE